MHHAYSSRELESQPLLQHPRKVAHKLVHTSAVNAAAYNTTSSQHYDAKQIHQHLECHADEAACHHPRPYFSRQEGRGRARLAIFDRGRSEVAQEDRYAQLLFLLFHSHSHTVDRLSLTHSCYLLCALLLMKQTHSCTTPFLESTRRHSLSRKLTTLRPRSKRKLHARRDFHLSAIRPWQWMSCSSVWKRLTWARFMAFSQSSCTRRSDFILSQFF